MAGSSDYPELVDNKTALQDGIDYMEADNVNNAYVPINKTQTFIGANGKGASWSSDILDYLSNTKAPIVTKASSSTLSVSAGAIVIKNSAQSHRMLRRTTSAITVTASDIDTGSMADATGYYVFAVADTAATTFTVKFSLSPTAPTGLTHFELIGWFWNESAGALNVTSGFVGNVKGNGRDVPNKVQIVASSAISAQTVDATYTVLTGFTAHFYSSGRPVLITFGGNFTLASTDQQVVFASHIGGSAYKQSSLYSYGSQCTFLHHIEELAAGFYVIDIRHKDGSPAAGTVATNPSSDSNSTPALTIIEL